MFCQALNIENKDGKWYISSLFETTF